MEIVTYVLEGTLDHKDSTGGVGHIRTGEVQRMTAGTGIRHSEYNSSTDERVRLLQMWVLPDRAGHEPSYEQRQFSEAERTNTLLPIASGQSPGDAVKVNQDVTFYVSKALAGNYLTHKLDLGRRAFLYVIDGELSVGGETLRTGDQARITDTAQLDLQATSKAAT
jgi:redox-sensitive bicupin YhaK (pirin superfamily)